MADLWLDDRDIEPLVPLMAHLGVSRVARSARGFLTAYRRAGYDPRRLTETWQRRRAAFVARHMAQVEKRREPLWTADGDPTRRHLALVAWAYSPDAVRLSRWVARHAG